MLQLTKILSWGKKESSREKLTKYMAGAHVPCLNPAGRVTPLAQLTHARDSGFTPGLSQLYYHLAADTITHAMRLFFPAQTGEECSAR